MMSSMSERSSGSWRFYAGAALVTILVFAAVLTSRAERTARITQADEQARLLQAIASKDISDAELVKSTVKLKKSAGDTPAYWSAIANDPSYSVFHRRCAVFHLFKRHVRVGMRLSELAKVLAHPKWLREVDVHVYDYLFGYVPVHFREGDTIFVIRVLPTSDSDGWAIYFRASGEIDEQGLRQVLLGASKPEIGKSRIVEITYCRGNSWERYVIRK